MGFLIPDGEMSKADLKALRAEIVNALLDMAAKDTKRARSEFVVRDAFPKTDFYTAAYDFGCEWQNQSDLDATDVWEKDWTKELPKNKFVCFYGVIYHDSAALLGANAAEGFPLLGVSYRMGTDGATTKEQIHLQKMMREFRVGSCSARVPIGYHKPIYYKGTDTINVNLIGNATLTDGDEQLELLCMVCEPFGNVISGKKELMPEQTSLLIPEDDMSIAEIKALREEVKARLLAITSKETGKPIGDLVVRDIFPKSDFGFNGVEWQNQTAITSEDTWTKDWTKELPKTKFVGFYGVDYPVGAEYNYYGVSYKLGLAGGTTLKQVHLQKAMRREYDTAGVLRSARGYHRPVYYKGTQTINLQLLANATVTQYYENLQLLGLLCEPKGAVISV